MTHLADKARCVLRLALQWRLASQMASAFVVVFLLMVLPVLLPTARAQSKRLLAVEEALQIAQAQSPERKAANFRAASQRQATRATISQMLPRLSLVEEYQRYNNPFGLAFGPAYFKARERGINTVNIAASQPLVGFLVLNEERASGARQTQAAQYDGLVIERGLAARIKTLYLRFFEARAMGQIAAASEATLHEQVVVADKKLTAGVLTRADVLRLQVAAASAKQDGIAADAQQRQVRAALLEDLGLVAEADNIDFIEPHFGLQGDVQPQHAADMDARHMALKQRPEVLSLRQQVASAHHSAQGQWLRLLPQISAEGGYIHTTGQQLAPVDQVFVGVKADWAFWEWGASVFRGKQASALEHAVRADLDHMQRQVGTEVAGRQADTTAAASAIEVSQIALQSAEEAFRVTSQQNQAGAATTTDLLDAESALTRVRLNLVRARYDYSISQVALDLAMGNP